MKCLYIAAAVLLLATPGFAQADGVVGMASRMVTLTPAEAIFQITVATNQNKALDEVLPKLKDLGIGPEHLLGINFQAYGPAPTPAQVSYLFRLTVPLAKIKETTDKIAQIRRSESEMDVQGFMSGVQASESAAEEARKRVFPELLAEARKRAEDLAREAKMTAGRILSISEAPGPYYAYAYGPSALTVGFSVTVRVALE